MSNIKIYKANKIISMNKDHPIASYIAIQGDTIVDIGGEDLVNKYPNAFLDTTFETKTLLPGFVEAHSHATEGCMWQYPYIGYFDRTAPDGSVWSGQQSRKSIVELLKNQLQDQDRLIAWGYDPIYFDENSKLNRHDLDKISTDIPILIFHASFHILIANTYLLNQLNVSKDSHNISGLVKDEQGELTGELQGFAVRSMALATIQWNRFSEMAKEVSLWNFANSAKQAGVTTATDLANTIPDDALENLLRITDNPNYPLRIVVALLGNALSPKEACQKIDAIYPLNTEKIRFGPLKLTVDGSIQGFTARMLNPGYYNGKENGLWYIDPTQLVTMFTEYSKNNIQVHVHVNGDEAIDTVINAMESTFNVHQPEDHRWTLQHFQLAHETHYQKAKELELCVNLFSNHLFYWGDIHKTITVGPNRAAQMNSAAWAKKYQIPYSIHSDAPITPLAPLFTAWCATNRLTTSGETLGPEHKISLDEALHAITLGAAYTLQLDDEIGSLEPNKKADIAILEQDPYNTPIQELKNIPVWGTMLGGKIFPNENKQ